MLSIYGVDIFCQPEGQSSQVAFTAMMRSELICVTTVVRPCSVSNSHMAWGVCLCSIPVEQGGTKQGARLAKIVIINLVDRTETVSMDIQASLEDRCGEGELYLVIPEENHPSLGGDLPRCPQGQPLVWVSHMLSLSPFSKS